MRRQARISGRITRVRMRLLLAVFATLGVAGAVGIAGAGAPPAALGQAAARPNIVVIETDDQTLESMRVMDNVNSLLGEQGATFQNSFVNYSLCCPSRATFLTGQYMHNHGVLSNVPPNGGFNRFQALHGSNNLAVWLRGAGYYTAHDRQVPERLREQAPGAAGLVGVARGQPAGLRLHPERERHPGPLRQRPGRLQAGRADRKGGQPRRPPGPAAAAVLPLAHLHGSPLRRPRTRTRTRPSTATARRSPRLATPTRSTPSPCPAPELQRGRRLRQAGRRSRTARFWARARSRTSSAGIAAAWSPSSRWTRASRRSSTSSRRRASSQAPCSCSPPTTASSTANTVSPVRRRTSTRSRSGCRS